MLIVVEGLDGAGKSTQVSLLREYLQRRCPSLQYIHFPRYDAPVYGDLISSFLRGEFGNINEVHPRLVALLYAEDRHGASPSMKEVLSRGGTILLDRYVYSNIAYQCAKIPDEKQRSDLRNWILETEYGDFGLPKPDINIFLDVPLSFIRSNLLSHREGQDRGYLSGRGDIHEADLSFQERVRDQYVLQASLDPSFRRVDCSGEDGGIDSVERIFSRIREAVEAVLDKGNGEG